MNITFNSSYEIQTETDTIGRNYDNNAESFSVTLPTGETHTCYMSIWKDEIFIKQVEVGSTAILIDDTITIYPYIDICFHFYGEDYLRNTDIKRLYIEKSKPIHLED